MEKKMSVLNNINKDPKARNGLIIVAVIGVLAIGGGLMFAQKSDTEVVTANASIAKAPSNVNESVGTSSSALYNKKIEENNQNEAAKAIEEGKTFIPTPSNKGAFNSSSPIDELDAQIKAQQAQAISEKVLEEPKEEVTVPPVPAPEPVAEVKQEPVVIPQPQPIVVQPTPVVQRVPRVEKKFGTDEDYMLLSAVTDNWKTKSSDSEFDFAKKGNGQSQQQRVGVPSAESMVTSTSKAEESKGKLINKAGTIYNAILETGINSDEPSPVLAKIVSGPLKGTRLIGKMNTSGEKVVVEFSTASVPSYSSSIKISGIAIDPNTSRTGLASDVDRHYFLKYGVLLGATFLGGYADAISQKGQVCTTSALGTTTCQTNGAISTKEINQKAIGAVGKELATTTKAQVANIKPTITVNAGSAIGILLMEDLYEGTK